MLEYTLYLIDVNDKLRILYSKDEEAYIKNIITLNLSKSLPHKGLGHTRFSEQTYMKYMSPQRVHIWYRGTLHKNTSITCVISFYNDK